METKKPGKAPRKQPQKKGETKVCGRLGLHNTRAHFLAMGNVGRKVLGLQLRSGSDGPCYPAGVWRGALAEQLAANLLGMQQQEKKVPPKTFHGNAIVPQVAVEFIRSAMETQKGSEVV